MGEAKQPKQDPPAKGNGDKPSPVYRDRIVGPRDTPPPPDDRRRN